MSLELLAGLSRGERCFESQEAEAGRAPRGCCNSPEMLVAWIKVVAREEVRSGEIWGVV